MGKPSYNEVVALEDNEGDSNQLKYLPLVSVDVERSFSYIRLIETDRRTCFTDDNIKFYVVVYFHAIDLRINAFCVFISTSRMGF